MHKSILLLFLFYHTFVISQEDTYPVYKNCETQNANTLASCFKHELTKDVLSAFTVPENVTKDNYVGSVHVMFVVTKTGEFEILHITTDYPELKEEVRRVFKTLPKAKPGTFNGRPVDMRFGLPIAIPLNADNIPKLEQKTTVPTTITTENQPVKTDEKETVIVKKPLPAITTEEPFEESLFPEHNSQLNIPLNYSTNAEMSYYLERGENTHTGFKPLLYNNVDKYADLDAKKTALFKDKTSKAGKKLWNEHFFKVQKPDYWFTVDPLFDLQLGKDNSDQVDYTYNNTRAIQIQGGLGKQFNFYAAIYESQGRFADYINDFARTKRPSGASSYGLVPGRGKAKDFKEDSFDYPVAEAYLSYTPNKFFNFQFGHGKNFIGDGYRSFMLSDVASPYPFLKISTKFWKIKYTNLWMWLEDVRPGLLEDGLSARKYVAIHHLSWNATKRLNLSFFEAAITKQTETSGFDINYFNPIIFYRTVEFSRGSAGGNAVVGLNAKYKLSDNFSAYTQFVLDELTVGKFFSGEGYWGNKFAWQIGAKSYNALGIENLFLQGEFNIARPYIYSHETPILNYAHYNQPLGHLWGSNFWEVVGIANYQKDRWYGKVKVNLGNKGFDQNGLNYGGNIYLSNDDRISDEGIELLQGNNTRIFIGNIEAGYVVNPATNTKLFAGFLYRNFNPAMPLVNFQKNNTTWFTIGLKADLFNWYFDF
ncbi:MAG: gliding motility protein RemB [Flavobacteriales bacterium]|nr:MAG: gliding motility protein RemB [Flavobacteriales bacterium]